MSKQTASPNVVNRWLLPSVGGSRPVPSPAASA